MRIAPLALDARGVVEVVLPLIGAHRVASHDRRRRRVDRELRELAVQAEVADRRPAAEEEAAVLDLQLDRLAALGVAFVPERTVGAEVAGTRQHADLPVAEDVDHLVELIARHRAEPAGHLPPRAEFLIDRFRPAKIEHRKHQPLVGDVLQQQRQEPVRRIVGQNAADTRMHLFQCENHRRRVGPISAVGQLHHRDDALTCLGKLPFRITKLGRNNPDRVKSGDTARQRAS